MWWLTSAHLELPITWNSVDIARYCKATVHQMDRLDRLDRFETALFGNRGTA